MARWVEQSRSTDRLLDASQATLVENPPPGDYDVEVSVGPFPADLFNQQTLQSFALVFAGTGPEVAFNLPVASVQGAAVY